MPLGRIASGLFSRSTALLAAGLLAAVIMSPSVAEARINPQQFLLARQCAALTPTERAQRDEDPCVKLQNAFHRTENGEAAGDKIKAALADILCRLLSSDRVEGTRDSGTALLTGAQQQLLCTTLPAPIECPGGDFGPEPAQRNVEYLPLARLPDG